MLKALKLEQMYKLGACLCSLKCVSRSHKLPLPTQKLFTNFLLFLLQHSHIHYTLFSADSHMGLGSTLTLAILAQIPNTSTLYRICFAQSPPLVNYIDSSKEKITLGVLWECGKI
jgi:hypothetical protein